MEAVTNENNCRNCGVELPPDANFCPACGQKNTDGRFTFRELMENLFENLLSLDARIFQTLAALAVPGKLTESFFQGKHIRYYHPVRLFIFSAALMIAAITLCMPKDELEDAEGDWQEQKSDFENILLFEKLDTLTQQAKSTTNDSTTLQILDSLSVQIDSLYPRTQLDSIPLGQIINLGPNTQTGGTMMSMEDVMTMTPDSLCQKYEVTGLIDRAMVGQSLRIMRSPSGFLFYFIGNTIWMVLVMMPMLALVLKLVYFRRPFLYYEHLVFSFHVHTFLFLITTLLLLLQIWLGEYVVIIGVPLTFIYPLLAQKRFYKQAWWKTILKSIVVSILYLVIFVLAFVLMAMASVILF